MHYKTMLILDGKENLIDKVFHIPENRLEQLAQSSHTWAFMIIIRHLKNYFINLACWF